MKLINLCTLDNYMDYKSTMFSLLWASSLLIGTSFSDSPIYLLGLLPLIYIYHVEIHEELKYVLMYVKGRRMNGLYTVMEVKKYIVTEHTRVKINQLHPVYTDLKKKLIYFNPIKYIILIVNIIAVFFLRERFVFISFIVHSFICFDVFEPTEVTRCYKLFTDSGKFVGFQINDLQLVTKDFESFEINNGHLRITIHGVELNFQVKGVKWFAEENQVKD